MDILPGLFSEDQVAERFGVGVRVVREHACAKRIGSKFSRKRYFTEADILELMKGGKATCSGSSKGGARRSGMSEGRLPGELSTRLQKQKTKAMLDGLRGRSKSSLQDQPAKNVTPLRSKTQPLST
jgi:hypothetical protein